MPIGTAILLWVLTGMAGALLVYWGVVAYHVWRTVRRVPTLKAALGMAAPAAWPRVCVVVPAHNEERCIETVLGTLRAQDYGAMRVVFALDRCTDGTARLVRAGIAGDERFEVVEIEECAPGWTGKTHAMWSGAMRGEGARDAEVLLFVDADTMLGPECVRAAVMMLRARELSMLSLLTTLTSDRWFEKLVQPAASMELVRQYPIERANNREKPRAFANGQFIMVDRGVYDELGGHGCVKSEVLEDVWLARHLTRAGHAAGLFFAEELLGCRMYSSWEAFKKGWRRIYGECANRKPGRLREMAWRLRAVGTILPAGAVLGVIVGAVMGEAGAVWVSGAALAVFWGVLAVTYKIGGTAWGYAVAYPVGAWMAGSMMLRAARELEAGTPTEWGGMTYRREAR